MAAAIKVVELVLHQSPIKQQLTITAATAIVTILAIAMTTIVMATMQKVVMEEFVRINKALTTENFIVELSKLKFQFVLIVPIELNFGLVDAIQFVRMKASD